MKTPEAYVIQLPTMMKAVQDGDRRLVEICASKQVVDAEGDLVLQSALLGSAPTFVKSGHLDLEHISEIFDRIPGIQGTREDYKVGTPVEVKDLGGGSTGVVGELRRGNKHADEIWAGLTASPPERWQASIYGFPTSDGLLDARVSKAEEMMGATRYLVREIDWRSLAFTRRPINTAVDAARVYTSKALVAFMKAHWGAEKADGEIPMPTSFILPPRNREELMGHMFYHMRTQRCPYVNKSMGSSVENFRQHFMLCCGEPEWDADIKALALMHLLKREKIGTLGLSRRE